MSGTSYREYSSGRTDVTDSYDYPNIDTYRAGRPFGTTLRKGAIFSVDSAQITVSGSPTSGSTAPITTTSASQKFFKRFQFNPPTLQLQTSFSPLDPPGSEQTGGNVNPVSTGMGIMSCSVELLFSRETETFRATNGNLGGGRMNAQSAAVYAAIGVQKDIYDLYRVALASDVTDGKNDLALPDEMTLSALSGKAFDLAVAGSQMRGRFVGLMFSEQMVVYGFISGLNISYQKFNKNLVPVMASANISIDVTNVRPSATSAASGSVLTTATAPPGPAAVANLTPSAAPVSLGANVASGFGLPFGLP